MKSSLDRNFPSYRYVSTGDPSRKIISEWIPSNDQEWSVPNVGAMERISMMDSDSAPPILEHKVKVSFATDIYGTFRQSVVFDFGGEPVLVRHLCVDVVPVTDVDRMKEIRKELVLSTVERWDTANAEIVAFSSPVTPLVPTPAAIAKDSERERDLLNAYPSPRGDTFTLTQSTVTEKKLTRNNYRARIHELLCVEEMARYEQVSTVLIFYHKIILIYLPTVKPRYRTAVYFPQYMVPYGEDEGKLKCQIIRNICSHIFMHASGAVD